MTAQQTSAANPPGAGVVAVAVSGGRDSVALLHATLRSAPALGLRVVALHVHHGLMAAADGWLADLEVQGERVGQGKLHHRPDARARDLVGLRGDQRHGSRISNLDMRPGRRLGNLSPATPPSW